MKCPVDETTLEMADRSEVEIDYCPSSRGVWLDRGELDKIIERGSNMPEPKTVREEYHDYPRRQHKPKKGCGGFLGEIFDF
ncbi:zf-TFIIB domain-containing protein [Blastomonas sp.]|uniref:TFIIB-type zinc ribbon-containing protein n=1 Tax=Blastomonas sp. TaxID=1909299 RepID=UPI003592FDA1